MEQFDAIDIIARTRGKVNMDSAPTENYIFVLWGSLTAAAFLLEFALWKLFRAEWCLWLWILIPAVGFPWMMRILRKNHERTHIRSKESKVVLDTWIFIGGASGVSGFIFGFAGVYNSFALPLICTLVGIGAFITGEVLRYRPMIAGGVAGALIGICSYLLQGELWIWQALALAVAGIIALVAPGILYKRSFKNGV